MPVLKSLPQWPNPHESIGRQIPSSRVGKRTVWWPRGPALEAFEKHIQPEIENNLQRIDLGHVDLFIRLYMIGRKPESANPIVMVCCINSKARDLAEATIRESSLLDRHEGFGLGAATLPLEHPMPVRRLSPGNEGRDYSTRSSKFSTNSMPSEPLLPLLENPSIHPPSNDTRPSSRGFSPINQPLPPVVYTLPDATKPDISNTSLLVFASSPQPLLGRRICISGNNSRSSLRFQYATAGVIIKVEGNYYQLTAGHLFEVERENLDTEQPPAPLDECHFDGQSDDEPFNSDHDTEMTGRGSITSESVGSWDGSASDCSAEETKTTATDLNDLSFVRGTQSSGGKGSKAPENPTIANLTIPIGYLPLNSSSRSPIDYAIIALPCDSVKSIGHKLNTPVPNLCVRNITEIRHKERGIVVVTHSTVIRGVLIPGNVAYKSYQTLQFQKRVQIQLENEIFPGDSGSPVLDQSTGSFYGHITMGVPGTKIAYIVKAADIFQDIETRMGKPARIATMTDLSEVKPLSSPESRVSTTRSRFSYSANVRGRHYSASSSAGSMYSGSGTSMFSEGSTYSSISSAPDLASPDNVAPVRGLPCEFVGYTNCDLVFPVNDVEGWIEHIVSDHLHGRLPSICRCWYCDDIIFDSQRAGGPLINFQQRMWHIRSHILDGLTVHDIRPDYYLAEHLRHYRLIPEHVYHSVRRYTEVSLPTGTGPLDEVGYEYRSREEERRDRRHRHKSEETRK
ncbi:hypothetical protein GGR51DRAFT_559163 [Nemania sp. FL0031]|nr:hypothetical protein GGR51DRAFT_559163 [Nemania sp. FL0031]